MRMGGGLKVRAIVLMAGLAALMAGASIWNILDVEQAKRSGRDVADAAERISGPVLDLALALKEVQFDVVQVQQWLTDVSATRALDGLGDGFDKAAGFAARFDADTKAAVALADRLGYDALGERLATLRNRFSPYYAAGQTMAKAYVAGGPAAGNPLMGAFDAAAQSITEAVDGVLEEERRLVEADRTRLAGDIAAYGDDAGNATVMAEIGMAITLAGLAFAALAFLRAVLHPLGAISACVGRLTGGDLAVAVPATGRRDEIGGIARAVEALREAMVERRDAEARRAAAAADAATRSQTRDRLVAAFRVNVANLLEEVRGTMSGMHGTAAVLGDVAQRTAERATRTAASSEEASQNVQSVSAATDQLSASIQEIARRIGDTTAVVQAATRETVEMDQKVGRLGAAAHQIGQVVSLISDIAGQTNLLALNATIEAARAGESGRGFAVVAGEVKALAGQTAKATEEIARQVSAIQSATAEATASIRAITDTMARVDHATAAIAAAVEEQGAATADISRAVAEAAEGTRLVAETVSGLDESVRQAAGAADAVEDAVTTVSTKAGVLTETIDGFVRDVAA